MLRTTPSVEAGEGHSGTATAPKHRDCVCVCVPHNLPPKGTPNMAGFTPELHWGRKYSTHPPIWWKEQRRGRPPDCSTGDRQTNGGAGAEPGTLKKGTLKKEP